MSSTWIASSSTARDAMPMPGTVPGCVDPSRSGATRGARGSQPARSIHFGVQRRVRLGGPAPAELSGVHPQLVASLGVTVVVLETPANHLGHRVRLERVEIPGRGST